MTRNKPLYGPKGILAEKLPGYTERTQQTDLSNLVNFGIRESRNIIVEAPTGVGKSLSALAAILQRLQKDKGRQFIIVTATKALQDQYAQKELPFMKKLGYDFTYSVMKGIGNYICPLKTDHYLKDRKNVVSKVLREFLSRSESGDVSELSTQEYFMIRSAGLTSSREECLKKKCPLYESCFYYKARRESITTDIVVTNYHMFFTYLEARRKNKFVKILPSATNILFDEVHVMKDIARDFFSFEFKQESLRQVINFLNKRSPDTALDLDRCNNNFFKMLEGNIGPNRRMLAFDLNPQYFNQIVTPLISTIEIAEALIEREISNLKSSLGNTESIEGMRSVQAVEKYAKQCSNLVYRLGVMKGLIGNDDAIEISGHTLWVDCYEDTVISMRPLRVDAYLKTLEELYQQCTFMSATIDTKDLIYCLGMSQEVENRTIQKILPDVFDYEKQAALAIPAIKFVTDDPEAYDDSVAKCLCDIVKMLEGKGILALFTSYKSMNVAAKMIRQFCADDMEDEPLVQGRDSNPNYLISEFRKGDRILLATKAFFQGVDFSGDACRLVFINKLPFKNYDDPVIMALTRLDDDTVFAREHLPYVRIMFKQAFGRLIRTEKDTGVVVCPDIRLLTHSYGEAIRKKLPENLPIVSDWDEFIDKLELLCGGE